MPLLLHHPPMDYSPLPSNPSELHMLQDHPKQMVGRVAQPWDHTKTNLTVCFKKKNYVIYELYLNNNIITIMPPLKLPSTKNCALLPIHISWSLEHLACGPQFWLLIRTTWGVFTIHMCRPWPKPTESVSLGLALVFFKTPSVIPMCRQVLEPLV